MPVEFSSSPALVLGPEALSLHLIWHSSVQRNGEPGLLWLYDIAEVIRFYSEELNWETLLTKAEVAHSVLSVQRILPRVAEDFDAPVPDEVLAHCMHMRASKEEELVFASRIGEERSPAHRVWSDLASLSGWTERMRYLSSFVLKRFLAPPVYMIARYQIRHPVLLPAYYLLRLVTYLFDGVKLLVDQSEK